MRHERMEHLRRMGQGAKELDATHPFDENNPRKWVWTAAVSGDAQWWKQELEDPAFFVLAKIRSLASVVDGDAQVAGAPAPLKRKAEEALMQNIEPPPLAIADRQPKKPKRTGPSQAQSPGGKHICKKKGAERCGGYRAGSDTHLQAYKTV